MLCMNVHMEAWEWFLGTSLNGSYTDIPCINVAPMPTWYLFGSKNLYSILLACPEIDLTAEPCLQSLYSNFNSQLSF